ncbi:MAG: xanthine phosphoribosyltransferase [Campylobacterota bacterium]|nr:xanthine phosphoribosyltransferase [Campylobacterota bacterium]
MKYYSYENFKNDTKVLIGMLEGLKCDAIVTIARGGLTLSHALSEALEIRNVQSIRSQLYDDAIKREHITLLGKCELNGLKSVLVVDDIADSGETLSAVMKYLQDMYIDIDFKSCTLFYKKTSVYEPHFWVNEADEWIDFFWEADFKN